MVLITSKDCPLCKLLKSRLDASGQEYEEMDAAALRDGDLGNTEQTRCAIVGLMLKNLELPVLLEGGGVVDISKDYIGDMECVDGVCKLR